MGSGWVEGCYNGPGWGPHRRHTSWRELCSVVGGPHQTGKTWARGQRWPHPLHRESHRHWGYRRQIQSQDQLKVKTK